MRTQKWVTGGGRVPTCSVKQSLRTARRRPGRWRYLTLLGTLVTAAGFAEQAYMEEIQVTAQKRTQNLIDVPIALSAFSRQSLTRLGVDSLETLSELVPGVRIQEQSVSTSGFAIRGITSDQAAATNHPRVSVFQNGVDISRARGANIALYDLERIEVMRGPQGTLFGRGAQIGALSVIQHKAGREDSAELTVGAGNFDQLQLQGYLNRELSDEQLALRLAFYRHQRQGTIENLAGGSLNGVDTRAARLSLGWQGLAGRRWDLVLNYQADTPPGTAFESFYFAERDPFEEARLDAGNGLGIDRELFDISLIGELPLSGTWSLTTISAYREFDSRETFDADGFSLPILELDEVVKHHQFSQELRFNLQTDRYTGFFGVNSYWEEGEQKINQRLHEGYLPLLPRVAAFLSDPGAPFDEELLLQPPPVFAPFAPLQNAHQVHPLFPDFLRLNSDTYESQTRGGENLALDLFTDISYILSDRLTLSAGLRLSYENVRSELRTPVPESAATLALATASCGQGLIFQPLCDPETGTLIARRVRQSDHFWGLVGRAVLSYRFNPGLHSYISYSRGRRPQVLDFRNNSLADNQDEELVDSLELGIKYLSADHRLSMEVGAFYYDYRNFVTVQNNSPVPATDDNGKAGASGLEWTVRQSIIPQWSVFANLAYIDARIDEDADLPLAGDRFRLSPLWSGALGSRYEFAGSWGQNAVTLTYGFQSTVMFEDDNRSNLSRNRQGSYGLLNLRWELEDSSRAWLLSLWVDNLLDKKVFIDAGNTGNRYGLATYVPGNPRLWGASLRWRFL